MAGVAEWEREQISSRTLDAAAEPHAAGKKMGRAGVRDTNPEFAERIRSERAAGSTWQAIADRLDADGVPTVRGGSQWRVSAVQSAAGYVRQPPLRRRVKLPVLGQRGWAMITNDPRIRTRPSEAALALEHRLKVVHLHGNVGYQSAWAQAIRLFTRREAIEAHLAAHPHGPWWLSARRQRVSPMRFEPGAVEHA